MTARASAICNHDYAPCPFCEPLIAERERDQANDALRRVVANESNHYDRYWTPAPSPLTDGWLDATEAKMREALTDAFCDDAAAVMLALIAEIRRLRAAP